MNDAKPSVEATAPAGTPRPRHQHEVFSASKADHLDTWFRKYLYHPDRLAARYVKPGDRALDFGCGPGFFTREFAKRVGDTGRVIAVDLQAEMLRIVEQKLVPEGLMPRIETHQCAPDSLLLSPAMDGKIDVAFAIFVVHEVPDPAKLFREIAALVKPGGTFFYTEPFFVVPGTEFRENLALAEKAGFRLVRTSHYFLNRAAELRKD
jgi:ubiquinone/menaquinone biosynthesis C-methylase UbiE